MDLYNPNAPMNAKLNKLTHCKLSNQNYADAEAAWRPAPLVWEAGLASVYFANALASAFLQLTF